MEFFSSMKLASYFFQKRTSYAFLYLLVVSGIILLRLFFDQFEKDFTMKLTNRAVRAVGNGTFTYSIAKAEMIMFMLLKIWAWSFDFVVSSTFELLITPIGGVMVQHVMHSMLMTEDSSVFNISPATCEYTMTEGSKGIAKLIRIVFVNLLSHCLSIGSNFYYMYTNASKEYKKAAFVIMFLYIGLAFLKLIHLNKLFILTFEATQINSNKEKLYIEVVDNLSIVKSSREEEKAMTKYRKVLMQWEAVITKTKIFEYSNTFVFSLGFDAITTGAVLLFINDKFSKNPDLSMDLLAGSVNTYSSYIEHLPSLLNTCISLYKNICECVVLAQRLLDYTHYIKAEKAKKVIVDTFKESIEVKDLIYFAKDKLIFSGVNFTIKKGDRIALFGRNGSGKSSIFKLILGFDKFQGSISIDNVDIGKVSMPEYRDLITYVPQDTKLFDESIFYNLAFGNDKSYAEVIEECKRMKIHETIMSFPGGYNTIVGELGKNLNGGLRQKIFYTRAFLNNTDIYMFDEPTNNLDNVHNKFLFEYLDDPRFADKTFFVITHDQDLVRSFPKIFHFDEGKVCEVETL